MFGRRDLVVLAAMALVCAASVHAAGINCSMDKTKYWPTIKDAAKCTGNNRTWAEGICWRTNDPVDVSSVCPDGCEWSPASDKKKTVGCAPIPGKQLLVCGLNKL
jgi:hypothetical protein